MEQTNDNAGIIKTGYKMGDDGTESTEVSGGRDTGAFAVSTVTRKIDQTTYVVGLHFKEKGLTFSQVFKRVLKGVGS